MPILKSEIRKKTENSANFVGYYIPAKLASYLTLYCLSVGVTKTTILKQLLSDWIDKMQEDLKLTDLISIIAKRAYKMWIEPTDKPMRFKDFKFNLRKELEQKGLENYSDIIINELDNEKKKNDQ